MRCARCNRLIRHSVMVSGSAYGSSCARIVVGVKVRRSRRVKPDPKQLELLEVQP